MTPEETRLIKPGDLIVARTYKYEPSGTMCKVIKIQARSQSWSESKWPIHITYETLETSKINEIWYSLECFDRICSEYPSRLNLIAETL